MNENFLHNHPGIEQQLRDRGIITFQEDNHVIVERKEWLEAKQLIKDLTVNIDGFPDAEKGYSPPPVKHLDPSFRPVQGIKHDSDKPRFDLIPADALEEVAKVYTVGAKEYGDRNWELGLNYGRLFRAMMSHSWAWWGGERDDSKNKLHHLTSVVFNALALLHYELNKEKYSKWDDRK